jgi:hypothetical protein
MENPKKQTQTVELRSLLFAPMNPLFQHPK